jgi:hypothetical protein
MSPAVLSSLLMLSVALLAAPTGTARLVLAGTCQER